MELEQLITNWKTTNERLDTVQAGQRTLETEVNGKRMRTISNRLKVGPSIELVIASAIVISAGGFLADHFSELVASPVEALPFACLHGLGILLIWLNIRQLITISKVDYTKPIVEAQGEIGALRKLRVKASQALMLCGIPLWILLPITMGQAVFGPRFLGSLSGNWILANLIFGVGVSGLIIVLARRFGSESKFFGMINDLFAGTEIQRAEKLVSEIRLFESQDVLS